MPLILPTDILVFSMKKFEFMQLINLKLSIQIIIKI